MVQRQLNQKLELKPELKQKQKWSSINNKTALKCLTLLFCAFGMIRSYDEYTMQPFIIDEESVKSISNTTSRTSSTTILLLLLLILLLDDLHHQSSRLRLVNCSHQS